MLAMGVNLWRRNAVGGAPVPTNQFFMSNGDLNSFAPSNYGPGIIYVPSTNTFWFSVIAYNSVSGWATCQIHTYNATTKKWAGPYCAGTTTLNPPPNVHNNAAMMRDNNGHVHVMFGAQGATTASFSSTINADDPTAWKVYPNGHPVGATVGTTFQRMYNLGTSYLMFYSSVGIANAAATEGAFYVRALTINGSGVIADSASQTAMVDFSSVSANNIIVQLGGTWNDGTFIYFLATLNDATTKIETDVFCFKYRISDGALLNYAGTTTVLVGAQPINYAAARANFVLIDQTSAGHFAGGLTDLYIDGSNVAHMLYGDSASATNGTSTCSLLYTNSNLSFGSPVTVRTYTSTIAVPNISGALVPNGAGGLDIYYPDATFTAAAPQPGGNIQKVTLSGNTIGSPTQVLASGTYPLDLSFRIPGGTAAGRVGFQQTAYPYISTTPGVPVGEGLLQSYLYGDSGIVPRAITALPQATTDLLARFSVQPSGAYKTAIATLMQVLLDNGIYDGMDVFSILAASDAQSSLLNWIQPQFNLTTTASPVFTRNVGYATNGSSSFLDTGFTPSAGGRIRQNDSAVFGYFPVSTGANIVGANDASSIGMFVEITSTATIERMNNTTSLSQTQGAGVGFLLGTRILNASGIHTQFNGTFSGAIGSVSSTLPADTCRIGHVGTGFQAVNCGAFGVGRSLNQAQCAALETAVEAYMAAVASL